MYCTQIRDLDELKHRVTAIIATILWTCSKKYGRYWQRNFYNWNSLLSRSNLVGTIFVYCLRTISLGIIYCPYYPHLIILGFFLWSYIKDSMYCTQVNDLNEMKHKIMWSSLQFQRRCSKEYVSGGIPFRHCPCNQNCSSGSLLTSHKIFGICCSLCNK